MNNPFFLRLRSALLPVLTLGIFSAQADTITSPNGNIVVNVVTSGGNLVYSVTRGGTTVIETSPLGLTVGGTNLGSGVTITGGTNYSDSGTFQSRHGIHAMANKTRNGRKINVTHTASGRTYIVNASAWDSGVSLRYELGAGANTITADLTGFVLPTNSTVYYQADTSVYEGSLTSSTINAMAANMKLGPPATVALPSSGGFLGITQSALTNNVVFPNPYLFKVPGGTGRQLQVGYPTNINGSVGVSTTNAVYTPWNVIIVSSDLNGLVNSDIVETLTPNPNSSHFPNGALTSWCKPGRSVWDWLATGGTITPAFAMTNTTYAAKLGFEYNTVDDGWKNWNGGNPWPDVQNIVNHANGLNVRILLWKASVELQTAAQRDAFFNQLQAYGVAGAKVDFLDFGSGSASARERIQLMVDILNAAASRQLVINIHGTSKPTGLFKTFPNLMQVEAIFGKESYAGEFNVVTQPFVRFLAGPADFTPLALQGSFRGSRTIAAEVAAMVHMPGPLVTLTESAQNIYNSPFAPVINKIPSMWDETVVLGQSSLGNTCAMARRKGQDWVLAITNRGSSRSWTIPLSFLPSGVTYYADIIRDTSSAVESTTVTSASSLSVTASSTGGFVARFYREPTDGTYVVVNRKSALALQPQSGGTANGTQLVQNTYNGTDGFRWNLSSVGSGQYRMLGVASGKSIDVFDGQTGNNVPVNLYTWLNGTNQKFTFGSSGSGYFRPIFVHSGRAMTVNGASTSPGAGIIQFFDNNGTNAQWEFRAP